MRSHGYTLTNGATTMSRANAQTIGTGGGIGPAGLKHDSHQKASHDLPLRGHKTHDMAITKADWADDYAAWPRSTNPAVPAGRSGVDREKEHSVRGGASPERTIIHD